MAEYIDREALAMSVLGLTIVDPMVANYADAVLFQIQQAPAADVVEVKHGRWEKSEDDYCGLNIIQCSLCREEWCFECDDDVKDMNYHYCPNCGAKMEAE